MSITSTATNNDIEDRLPRNVWDVLKKKPVEIYDITFSPEEAKRIVNASIAADVNFRKLTEDKRFLGLVDAMKRGQWNWTDADPIRLHIHPDSGELVASDGQHRLRAAAVARRKLRSLVIFGEEYKSGLHLDRNKSRNAAQYLSHEYGIKGAAPYIAVARFHLARMRAFENKTTASYEAHAIDDESLIAFVIQHQQELTWSIARGQTGGARGFHVTAYGTFLYELLQISHDAASRFHEDMKDQHLDDLDPLAQLRKAVQRRSQETGKRMHREYTISNLAKAYVQRETGQTLTMWKNSSSDDVEFPAGFPVPGKRPEK